MKTYEYAKIHNLKTPEDWKNHFRGNMENNKLPVAMYICPVCFEILDDISKDCPMCNAKSMLRKQEGLNCISHEGTYGQ